LWSESNRANERRDNELPILVSCITDNAAQDPILVMPCTEAVEPARRNFLREREDPMAMNSKIDTWAPNFPKHRSDTEEPSWQLLSTESCDLTTQLGPHTERALPQRMVARSENVDPSRQKSNTDAADPMRPTARSETEEANSAAPSSESPSGPLTFIVSKRESEEPTRQKLRKDSDEPNMTASITERAVEHRNCARNEKLEPI
jgi:hypothetical protein